MSNFLQNFVGFSSSPLSQYQAQTNEVNHRNATVANVVQLQAETRCINTKKAYDKRQQRFMVRTFFFFVIVN